MITLIAAVDRNGMLGWSNGHPWTSPTDVEFFRTETQGGFLVMDQEYHDALPDLSTNRSIHIVRNINDVNLVTRLAWQLLHARIYILGGSRLYEKFLPYADRVLLSQANQVLPSGDVFPRLDLDTWKLNQTWLTGCTTVPVIKEYFPET